MFDLRSVYYFITLEKQCNNSIDLSLEEKNSEVMGTGCSGILTVFRDYYCKVTLLISDSLYCDDEG
jgi:hypothetical protein